MFVPSVGSTSQGRMRSWCTRKMCMENVSDKLSVSCELYNRANLRHTLRFNMSNTCGVCFKEFAQRRNVFRHERTVHGQLRFQCLVCGQIYTRSDALLVHQRNLHGERK